MSLIQAFYQKLHSQEISLETLRDTHKAFLQEWNMILAQSFDDPLIPVIESMFHSIEHNYLALPPLIGGEVTSDEIHDDYRVVRSWITLEQLKAIPRGYGGRAGVVLHTRDSYIFNLSNRYLISDFGGGVRAKHTPYKGLIKELKEECPTWVRYIEDNLHRARIHCVETYHRYDEEESRIRPRFSILVFLPFDQTLLKEFKPTKEALELVKVDKKDIEYFLERNRINSGLIHMFHNKVYS